MGQTPYVAPTRPVGPAAPALVTPAAVAKQFGRAASSDVDEILQTLVTLGRAGRGNAHNQAAPLVPGGNQCAQARRSLYVVSNRERLVPIYSTSSTGAVFRPESRVARGQNGDGTAKGGEKCP